MVDTDKFGAFTYRKGDDELLFSEHSSSKKGAIKLAKESFDGFKPSDRKGIYVEVWEKDGEGFYGQWGNPLFKLG
jgi:hypothetical protein